MNLYDLTFMLAFACFCIAGLVLLFTRSWQRSRFALVVAVVCGALLLVLTVVEVVFQS